MMPLSRLLPGTLALMILLMFLNWAANAPDHWPDPDLDLRCALPSVEPPFGSDLRGRPLMDYASQGAKVVAWPAVMAGLLVALFAMLGGVLRAVGWSWVDGLLQGLGEIVGALPRMVVVLIIALMMDRDQVSLMPLALAWALLSAPGAMDEAAAVAERLGGSRFVEALRAHGFSATRIYVHHLVLLNLRPVILRQAAEVMMQVIFLEVAFSYLAIRGNEPSFTHPDSQRSWADLLHMGSQVIISPSVCGGQATPTMGGDAATESLLPGLSMLLERAISVDTPGIQAFHLGLSLVALVAIMAMCIGRAGRPR